MPNTNKALNLLRMAIDKKTKNGKSFNQACVLVAQKTGYSRSYIISMYQTGKITDSAASKVIKALTVKKQRYSLKVYFKTESEKERARKLSMEERRERLLK